MLQAHGIDHLVIPTRDYCFAPSLNNICHAVNFIHSKHSLHHPFPALDHVEQYQLFYHLAEICLQMSGMWLFNSHYIQKKKKNLNFLPGDVSYEYLSFLMSLSCRKCVLWKNYICSLQSRTGTQHYCCNMLPGQFPAKEKFF